MVSHDPEKRPDAAEILKMDFMTSEHIKKESESASVWTFFYRKLC